MSILAVHVNICCCCPHNVVHPSIDHPHMSDTVLLYIIVLTTNSFWLNIKSTGLIYRLLAVQDIGKHYSYYGKTRLQNNIIFNFESKIIRYREILSVVTTRAIQSELVARLFLLV
jgi:hypothetical protein